MKVGGKLITPATVSNRGEATLQFKSTGKGKSIITTSLRSPIILQGMSLILKMLMLTYQLNRLIRLLLETIIIPTKVNSLVTTLRMIKMWNHPPTLWYSPLLRD